MFWTFCFFLPQQKLPLTRKLFLNISSSLLYQFELPRMVHQPPNVCNDINWTQNKTKMTLICNVRMHSSDIAGRTEKKREFQIVVHYRINSTVDSIPAAALNSHIRSYHSIYHCILNYVLFTWRTSISIHSTMFDRREKWSAQLVPIARWPSS